MPSPRSPCRRERGERDAERKLRLDQVAETASGRASRDILVGFEEALLLGRCRLCAGRAGNERDLAALGADSLPERGQRLGDGAAGGATRPVGIHTRKLRVRFCATCLGVLARFDHQEHATGAQRKSAPGAARPHRCVAVLQIEVAELVEHQHVLALTVVGGADQRDVALAGGDARQRNADSVDAGGFLAHERARGAGDAVHDGDVAGEQVRQLRQEQGGAQVAHQPFVQERRRGVALHAGGHDGAVDGDVALTAAGRDDHVGAAEDFGIALDAGGVEREACGVGADALPRLHLALIALLRDLLVEIQRRERMDDVGRKGFRVDIDRALLQRVPMRIQSFAERGDDADTGDPGFRVLHAITVIHERWPAPAGQSALPRPAYVCGIRRSGTGYG